MKLSSAYANYAAWLYLATLLFGYSVLGWLMAAFQVSWLVWLGTMAITLHLAHAGTDAIIIASTWVATIMSIGAVVKAWTPIWDSRMPWENAQLWAIGLLCIWMGSTLLTVLLAFAQHPLRSLHWNARFWTKGLLVLTWGAMAGGWLFYELFQL